MPALADAAVSSSFECSPCSDGSFVSRSDCNAALRANETEFIIDAAETTTTLVGDWAIVGSAPPSNGAPSTFLGPYYLSDDNDGKGTKSITFNVNVARPGTYAVYLLHPRGLLAASRIPVRLYADDQAQEDPLLVYVDQRTQSDANVTQGVGGTLIAEDVQLTASVSVTVSTELTNTNNDNLFGSFVYVDGLVVQARQVDAPCQICDAICSQHQFMEAPCTSSANRVCTNITRCDALPDSYLMAQATLTTDAECDDVDPCSPNQFQSQAPTTTTNRACQNITQSCDHADTYLAAAATPTTDTLCRPYCHDCDPNTQTLYPCDAGGLSGALIMNAVSESTSVANQLVSDPSLADIANVTFTRVGPWVTISQDDTQYLSDSNDNKGQVEFRIDITTRPGLYTVAFSFAPDSFIASDRVPVSFTHANGTFTTRVDQATIDPSGFFTLGTFYIDGDTTASFLIENRDSTKTGIDFGSRVTFGSLRLSSQQLPVICTPCPASVSCQPDEFVGPECVCTQATPCQQGHQYEAIAPTATSDRVCKNVTTCAQDEFQVVEPTATSNRVCQVVLPGCHELTVQTAAPTPTSDRQCESLCAPCPLGSYLTSQCQLYLDPDAENATTILDIFSDEVYAIGPWATVNAQVGDLSAYITDNDQNKGDVSVLVNITLPAGLYTLELAYLAQVDAATRVPVTLTTALKQEQQELDQRTIDDSGWHSFGTIYSDGKTPTTLLLENRGTHVNTDNFFGNEVTFAGVRIRDQHQKRQCALCSECAPGFLVDQECTPTSDTTCRGEADAPFATKQTDERKHKA